MAEFGVWGRMRMRVGWIRVERKSCLNRILPSCAGPVRLGAWGPRMSNSTVWECVIFGRALALFVSGAWANFKGFLVFYSFVRQTCAPRRTMSAHEQNFLIFDLFQNFAYSFIFHSNLKHVISYKLAHLLISQLVIKGIHGNLIHDISFQSIQITTYCTYRNSFN